MMNLPLKLLSLTCSTAVATIAAGATHAWDFDLTGAPAEWTFTAVDLPSDWQTNPQQPEFTLIGEERALPASVGDGTAWYLEGSNYSDDLFLYLYRKVDGLRPNTLYNLDFAVEFASRESQDTVGIGGSPGGSVWVKAAASPEEPARIVRDGYYRTPLAISNQAGSGTQGGVIGVYGYVEEPANGEWKLLRRELDTRRFAASSNEAGELWVAVGLDSGFEGTSAVYLTRFEVEATSGVWSEADRVQPGGWIHVPWFGWVLSGDLQGGWDYHTDFGWIHVADYLDLQHWFWDATLGWSYTRAELYPWLYSEGENEWIHLISKTENELVFERASGGTFTVPRG